MTRRSWFRSHTDSTLVLRSAFHLLWSESDGLAKLLVGVTLFLVLISSALAGLVPLLLKSVIDKLTLGPTAAPYTEIIFVLAAYVVAQWLGKSLKEVRSFSYGRADKRIGKNLSHRLFQHVMSLPLRFHLERQTGALSQTLTNGLTGCRLVLHHIMQTVLPVIVELVTIGTVLVLLNHAKYLAIIGTSVLLYSFVFWFGVTRIGNPARAVSDANIDANATLTDSILNYETVKHFDAEGQVQGRYGEALNRTENQWKELYRKKMDNGLAVAGIFALSLGTSVYFAVGEVQSGTMSIGAFVLVNAYVLQITQPLEMIGFAFRDVTEGIAFIERMVRLLSEKSEAEVVERHRDRAVRLPAGTPELIFENVSYGYHSNRRVLKNVNLIIPSGRTVAIVGASGSGKSSLIRLLVRLVEPIEGEIFLNGVPLSEIRASELRRSIAIVPQDIALFNDTIAYNIAFGRQGSTEDEIITAARVAHIHDFIAKLPHGYSTIVGERGLKLSGGEKQRIAIARAAIKRPKVFVFDEATSSLDSTSEQAILSDLIRVANAITTLVIAHRLSTVVHADEIVVLNAGRIVERGTHSTLLNRSGAYAAMWEAQHAAKSALWANPSIA